MLIGTDSSPGIPWHSFWNIVGCWPRHRGFSSQASDSVLLWAHMLLIVCIYGLICSWRSWKPSKHLCAHHCPLMSASCRVFFSLNKKKSFVITSSDSILFRSLQTIVCDLKRIHDFNLYLSCSFMNSSIYIFYDDLQSYFYLLIYTTIVERRGSASPNRLSTDSFNSNRYLSLTLFLNASCVYDFQSVNLIDSFFARRFCRGVLV